MGFNLVNFLDSIWPVVWSKALSNIDASNILVNSSRFVIESLNREHFGEYRCTSSNMFGTSQAILSINENEIILENSSKSSFNPASVVKKSKKSNKLKKRQRLVGLELRKRRFKKRFKHTKNHELL